MAVTRAADSGSAASLCQFECVAVFYRSFLFLFLAYVLGVALNSQLGEFRERIIFFSKGILYQQVIASCLVWALLKRALLRTLCTLP